MNACVPNMQRDGEINRYPIFVTHSIYMRHLSLQTVTVYTHETQGIYEALNQLPIANTHSGPMRPLLNETYTHSSG